MNEEDIVETHNLCGVEFNVYNGPNAISVSGGADSALLLYFLLKYSKDRLHIFTLADGTKQITGAKSAVNVVYKCAQLTGNYNFEHHIDYSPDFIDTYIERLPFEYLDKKEFNVLYAGITNLPPKTDRMTFSKDFYHEMRNPDENRDVFRYGFSYIPWTNIDKKKIAEIYKEYNLLDSLFPITRSCEWNEIIGGQSPGMEHCGDCWWCNERQWAFGRLK
jgi:7-cyano-7-deazaguanine synthase in queuosine biosynthesis